MTAPQLTARRVLVTGATGFIGRHLVAHLRARGDAPLLHVRNADKARALFGTDTELCMDLAAIGATERIDAIVNLAGESIAGGLWTARRRERLLGSRIGVTRELGELVARLARKPRSWINASAVGYYGVRGDEPLDEHAAPGRGFQAELCERWEEAASAAATDEIAVTRLRLGVVLARDGGALPALARPVRLFAGTVLGTGRQWFSWIHLDDALALVELALTRALAGPLNATAPTPVRYAELMAALGAALHRPIWPLHVPAAPVRLVLGEMAELFVDGQRVVPARAAELGFAFRYPTIAAALAEIFGPSTAPPLSGSR